MQNTVGIQGLSQREVATRRAAGQGNTTEIQTGRTYRNIFRDNVFTFINGVYFFLSLILIVLGRPSDVFVMLISIQVLGALLLLPFLKPPTPAWVGIEPLSGDWRYSVLALLMLGVYLLILAVPGLRSFFGLLPLSVNEYLIIGLVAVVCCLVLRYVWRYRILDRFLGITLR